MAIWLVAALIVSLGLITFGVVFDITPLVSGGGAGGLITLFQGIGFISHARSEAPAPLVEEQD